MTEGSVVEGCPMLRTTPFPPKATSKTSSRTQNPNPYLNSPALLASPVPDQSNSICTSTLLPILLHSTLPDARHPIRYAPDVWQRKERAHDRQLTHEVEDHGEEVSTRSRRVSSRLVCCVWRGKKGTYPKRPMNPTASINTPTIGYLKNTSALRNVSHKHTLFPIAEDGR
jgi:hypothetical protein